MLAFATFGLSATPSTSYQLHPEGHPAPSVALRGAVQPRHATMLPAEPGTKMSCLTMPHAGMTHQLEVIRPACDREAGECGEPYAATLVHCTSVVEPGVRAQSWLLGPFESTGGYDWWFHDGRLPHNMTDIGDAVAVGSYSMTFHEGEPPAAGAPRGEQLGLPPIHNHHSKFTLVDNFYDQELPYAQAGSECARGHSTSTPNTPACQLRDFASLGLMSPLYPGDLSNHGYLDAVYNDVRPANSTPVVWYINYTFTLLDEPYVRARQLRPAGTMIQTHAWKGSTPFSTVDIPAHEDSIMVWQGTFRMTGDLIGDTRIMHINTHSTRFRSALLIHGTASELGLNQARFFSPNGCEAIKTRHAGFASNAELIAYLRGRCPACFEMREKLMCSATSAFGVSDLGIAYGYNPTMNCAAPLMPVSPNDPYVAIAFLGPPADLPAGAEFYDEPGGTRMEHSGNAMHSGDTYPMHVHWKMWWSPRAHSPGANRTDVPTQDGVPVLWPGHLNATAGCQDNPENIFNFTLE